MNSTHTVVIKRDQRGLKFLIGSAAIFLLVRWYFTGKVLMLSEVLSSSPSDGVGSITGVVLPLAIDLVIMGGGILLAIFSGVWAVIWDVVSGIIDMIKLRNAQSRAVNAAVEAATGAGTMQASANAGAAASVAASVAATQEPASFEDRVKASFREQRKRIEALEAVIFPPPPPELTVEELKAALAEKEASLAEKDAMLAELEANRPVRSSKAKAGAS